MDDTAKHRDDIDTELANIKRDAEKKGLVEAIKKELQEFSDKKPSTIEDYKRNYPKYLKDWSERFEDTTKLLCAINCQFEDWKDILNAAVKPLVDELNIQVNRAITAEERQIKAEDSLAKKNREKTKLANYKRTFDAWLDANKGIGDKLKAHKAKIDDVNKLLSTPDAIISLYRMWWEILPTEGALTPTHTPEHFSSEARTPGRDSADQQWSFEEAQEPGEKQTAEQEGEAASAAASKPYHSDDPLKQPMNFPPDTPRVAPWILTPDELARKLDQAWRRYRGLKRQIGEAETEFKVANEELAAETKKLKELRDGLGEKIKRALKEWIAAQMNQAA